MSDLFYTVPHRELENDASEKISLSLATKGVIVFAKSNKPSYSEPKWLILISHIEEGPKTQIYRHVAYDMTDGGYFIGKEVGKWGHMEDYDFYLATDKQKQVIKDIIKYHKLKYIKALNKLIDR